MVLLQIWAICEFWDIEEVSHYSSSRQKEKLLNINSVV